MPTQTNEKALESAIQETLSGMTIEAIREKDPAANVAEESEQYRTGNRYFIRYANDFNALYAGNRRWENNHILGS